MGLFVRNNKHRCLFGSLLPLPHIYTIINGSTASISTG